MKRAREEAAPAGAPAVAALGRQAATAGLDLAPGEELRHESARCRLFLRAHDAGEGTAFVTTECVARETRLLCRGARKEPRAQGASARALNPTTRPPARSARPVARRHPCRRLAWLAADGSHGFQLRYPAITLHATCRDLEAFPAPCIFAQLDVPVQDGEEEGAGEEHGGTGQPDLSRVDELRLQPPPPPPAAGAAAAAAGSAARDALDDLFDAISACQALHPDPAMDVEEGDDAGGEFGAAFGGYCLSMMDGGAAAAPAPDVAAFSAAQLAELGRLEGLLTTGGGEEGEGEGEEGGGEGAAEHEGGGQAS